MNQMKNSAPIASIILPVHNAGPYLEKCLGSLVSQTLQNIEIIAVLDCPTDGSDRLVKEYAKRFPQIVVLENASSLHIGNSRNRGLDAAKGKYIGFCDHDDWYAPIMCERFVHAMENYGYDMMVSPYVGIVRGQKEVLYTYPCMDSECLAKSVFSTAVGITDPGDPMRRFALSGVIWNKFFRRNLIEEHHIRFIDTKKASPEDLAFLMEYSYYATTCGICNEELYFHQIEINNTGATMAYNEMDKFLAGLEHTYEFLIRNNLYNKMQARFYNTVISMCHISLAATFRKCGLKAFLLAMNKMMRVDFVRTAYMNSKQCVLPKDDTWKSFLMMKFERFYMNTIHTNGGGI